MYRLQQRICLGECLALSFYDRSVYSFSYFFFFLLVVLSLFICFLLFLIYLSVYFLQQRFVLLSVVAIEKKKKIV